MRYAIKIRDYGQECAARFLQMVRRRWLLYCAGSSGGVENPAVAFKTLKSFPDRRELCDS